MRGKEKMKEGEKQDEEIKRIKGEKRGGWRKKRRWH